MENYRRGGENSRGRRGQSHKQNAQLQLRRQEPFAAWLGLDAFVLILIEISTRITTKTRQAKRIEMKADSEGRWKGEEKISRLSHSLPSSLQIDIGDSDSAEEIKHSKLGAKPKWWAHADRPCTSGEESSTTTIHRRGISARLAKIPLRRPLHRGGISHSGESLQQRQSRDCQNSQDVESSNNMKLYLGSMPSSTPS